MFPLAQMLVLVFLFKKVVPLNIDAYPAFVLCGLLPWTWFSTCLNSAGNLLIANRNLVRRPNFIPANLVIVNTISNLINYLAVLPTLFIIPVLYDRATTMSLLIFTLLILIQGILTAGIGLFIATLNVFYRDIQYITSVALMLLFYLTPIFYQFQDDGKRYSILYTLNPIAILMKSYQAIFFYGKLPGWGSLLFVGIISIVMCSLGYLVYKRYLHEVIDAL